MSMLQNVKIHILYRIVPGLCYRFKKFILCPVSFLVYVTECKINILSRIVPGLCYNNINEGDEVQFPTTVEDLQGFWDMVCLQCTNVDALYEHIAKLKENDWKEVSFIDYRYVDSFFIDLFKSN